MLLLLLPKLLLKVVLPLAVLAFFALPFLATETSWGAEKCAGGPEGSEARVEGWSWWPPGTECTLTLRDGTVVTEVVPPWSGDAWSGVDGGGGG